MDRIEKLIEEIRAAGVDFGTVQAAVQTAYGDTTPLGLNRWKPDDKPQMADFNRDNEILDREIRAVREELSNKANIGPPEKYSLPLLEQFEFFGDCFFFKSANNVVNISVSVRTTVETPVKYGTIIALLPEGFRPKSSIMCSGMGQRGTGRIALSIDVNPQGYIIAYTEHSDVTSVIGSFTYLAAQ